MQPVADIGDGPPGHGSLQTLGRMFAVFRAITTLQRIAQKLLHKTELIHYLQIYSQITAERKYLLSK